MKKLHTGFFSRRQWAAEFRAHSRECLFAAAILLVLSGVFLVRSPGQTEEQSLPDAEQAALEATLPAEQLATQEPDPTEKPTQRAANAVPLAAGTMPQGALALNLTIGSGDTLMSMLADTGVPASEAQDVVAALKTVVNPKRLDIGQSIALNLKDQAEGRVVTKLSMPISKLAHVELQRRGDGFEVKKIHAPTEKVLARAYGVISSSLYETGIKAGLSANMLEDIIKAFSHDVDFQRDIHPGYTLEVVYERVQTADGIPAGAGNVVFASLGMAKKRLNIYRYVDGAGHAEYYNEKGESIRKALLKTPINGAKITSGFGMRNHPLLGYTRMHRGVDFGAATGTPIYAAGDGVIEFIGPKSGYGNVVKIKHNEKYASLYAHTSRFAANLRVGSKVKQGQVIAYVGSSGLATGPHLHYEIWVNNQQVNPSGVKFKTGVVLAGKALKSFQSQTKQLGSQLAQLRSKPGSTLQLTAAAAEKSDRKTAKN